MANSTIPKNRSKLAVPPSIGSDEHPINVVNDRLDQVHAALDLLFTVGVDGDGFETLQQGTLAATLWGAMRHLEEARAAANAGRPSFFSFRAPKVAHV